MLAWTRHGLDTWISSAYAVVLSYLLFCLSLKLSSGNVSHLAMSGFWCISLSLGNKGRKGGGGGWKEHRPPLLFIVIFSSESLSTLNAHCVYLARISLKKHSIAS